MIIIFAVSRSREMTSKRETLIRQTAADLIYDIAGSVLYAVGLYTFAGNAGFAPGGISGLALILKTMIISSLMLDVIFPFTPMYEGNRMVAAVYSGIFLGAGMALFYMRGSSSGGIDFLALTIKKKRPYMSIGVITLLIDLVVILLGWPVFGDVDAVLYGVASTGASTIVIDKILYGIGAGTLAIIITDKGKAIAAGISEKAGRGVTSLPAVGGYTGMHRDVILCACTKSEANLVKTAVQETDADAFLMFTETSEVFGEGFKVKNI